MDSSVQFVVEEVIDRTSYLHTCSGEQPKSAGNSYNVTVVLCLHLRQEGLCHLLGRWGGYKR